MDTPAATAGARPGADRLERLAGLVGVAGACFLGLALPGALVVGGLAWLIALIAVASGWGFLVGRLCRVEDPDLGLRATWGLAAYIAVAGALVATGVGTRPVLLAMGAAGLGGFGWRELTTATPSGRALVDMLRPLRAQPALALLVLLLGGLALVHVAGAAAALDRNPWDDDIAYTPLIKRLLDRGDLIEPFSFRRLGAYGGQTVLGALAGLRGTLASVHLIDRGLCFALVLLLLVGHARARGAAATWLALVVLMLLLLPETAINTASHWSGVALFLALYRTAAWATTEDDGRGRGPWILVGLVGAATCTLRQNFIAVVVLFVGALLVARWWGARHTTGNRVAWRRERRNLLLVAGTALAATALWWVAAYRSSGTFLFPLLEGTWNHELSVTPAVMSWADELQFVVWASIETTPLVVLPALFVVLVFARDERPGQPLRAMFAAATLGFFVLVHGFAGTEPFHLWRYAFGFATALAAVLVLEVGADDEHGVRIEPIGRWLLLSALVLQLVATRGAVPARLRTVLADLREARAIGRLGDPSARAERQRYGRMQAAVPPDARLAIVLDDPAYLDFARNEIANLDTPGFASPAPQLPAFRGAEPLRSYLVTSGYRYIAFVRTDRSRYFYRRAFWLWRLFNDGELFQVMSAYAIDLIDSLDELASTTTVLYDADGLVVLDLDAPRRVASTQERLGDEATRRSSWTHDLAAREGLLDAWSLTSRADLRFEDGVAGLTFVDGGVDDAAWFEIVRPRETTSLRGTPVRPLHRRAHLRVRGASTMHLSMRVAIARSTVFTRPRLDVSLDGVLLASAVAGEDGRYALELDVPADVLAGGWHDLYLVFSSIADPDRDARDLRVARLESLTWTPRP